MECYCYFRDVQGLLADGWTLEEHWFNSPSMGRSVHFGAEVKFSPTGRVHQFGTKVFPVILLGNALNAGEVGLVTY